MNNWKTLTALALLAPACTALAETNTMRAAAANGRIYVTELKLAAKPDGHDAGWATWSQRGELVTRGQMTDSQGRLYNVRILPGYVAPWRFAGEGWSDAGGNVGEYFEGETWSEIADDAGDCFEWGWRDSFWEFGLRDSGRAWSDRFASAARRTEKKTFGWPIAYPWAFLSATVESVVRFPLGLVGAVLGTAGGVVVPAVETVAPAAKGVWNAGIEGTVLPVAGWAWNTVIAPPSALLASAPNPSRTDGVWMHILNDQEIRHDRAERHYTDEQAIELLAAYGRELDTLLAASARQRSELQKQQRAEINELTQRYETQYRQLSSNETAMLTRWLADPDNEAGVVKLAQDGWDGRAVQAVRDSLIQQLKAQGASDLEATRIAVRLVGNPPATTRVPRAYDHKTDPATESIRIFEDATDIRLGK